LYLWKQLREESLNRLAREVEDAMDMEAIFGWVGLTYRKISCPEENVDRSQQQGVTQ
jgi:adenosylcobyric acid synthase